VPISSAANINSFMSILLRLVYNITIYLIDGDVKEFLKMATFPGGSGSVPANVVTQDPITGALQVGGVNINALTPVYTWGVDTPLPSSLAAGSVIGIDPASFGGTYKTTVPIYLISDGTKYKPLFKQLLFDAPGSAASPISVGSVSKNVVSGTSSTFDLGAVAPSIPADFLSVVNFASIYCHIVRGATSTGATPAYSARFSTSNSITAGTIATISNVTETTATAGRKALLDGKARLTSDAYITKSSLNMPAAVGASTSVADTAFAPSSLNYLVVGVQSGGTAGDFFDVQSYSLWIE